ncbi:hypothetical protein HMPREF9621_01941 [Cutibacterium modestum HL037PA2]|nr:hypothetical protein HMPREF9621_01941 [Cutibacterium modestum HL037PA2]
MQFVVAVATRIGVVTADLFGGAGSPQRPPLSLTMTSTAGRRYT